MAALRSDWQSARHFVALLQNGCVWNLITGRDLATVRSTPSACQLGKGQQKKNLQFLRLN
jgi:hypothetical protein